MSREAPKPCRLNKPWILHQNKGFWMPLTKQKKKKNIVETFL